MRLKSEKHQFDRLCYDKIVELGFANEAVVFLNFLAQSLR